MNSPLAAAAGPIAPVAGLAFVAVDTARLLAADRSLDRIPMMRGTPFQVTNALYFAVFIGLVLALVSVYLRYAERTGAFGVTGFCAALVGTMDMAGNMWFDGFAAPWIADVAPAAILAGGSGMLAVGGSTATCCLPSGGSCSVSPDGKRACSWPGPARPSSSPGSRASTLACPRVAPRAGWRWRLAPRRWPYRPGRSFRPGQVQQFQQGGPGFQPELD